MSASPSSSTSHLPCYLPSAPAPCYAAEPTSDEQTLEQSPRHGSRTQHTGTYTKATGKVSIILNDQQDGIDTPSYGRHAVVSGIVTLEKPEKVTELVLEVRLP